MWGERWKITQFELFDPDNEDDSGEARRYILSGVGANDAHIEFGDPLDEEDALWEETPHVLDCEKLMTLLSKFGTRPWDENFYDFSRPVKCFRRHMQFPEIVGFDEVRDHFGRTF